MTIQVILRSKGKAKKVVHVKNEVFQIHGPSIRNLEPIQFWVCTSAMEFDSVSIGKHINMPLTSPKSVMRGDTLCFPVHALSITLE